MVNRGRELPGGSVDLVVTAMEDQVPSDCITSFDHQHVDCVLSACC